MSKVAVVGSRGFNDYELLCKTLDGMQVSTVISGGARGADTLAERYAKDHKLELSVFLADWERYGRAAGVKRNQTIIDNCDEVVAFWDGESRGTKHSIGLAEKSGKPVKIVRF